MTPTTQNIQIELADARRMVDDGKAYARLLENQDFKRLIVDGFAKREAVRLVNFRASDEVQENPDLLKRVERGIDAIGYLQEHFRKIEIQAEMSADSIASYTDEGLV